MNPCPRGFYGDAERECSCTAAAVTRYQLRISGPLLNRFDIHMEVPRVNHEKLTAERLCATFPNAARARQQKRFSKSDLLANTDMRQLQLSARAFHRILKLAHTIADLADSDANLQALVAEAGQHRPCRQH
jgi:magnesium chelatase family protein